MNRLPNVKNVNKGKRHKKKHQFKVGVPIVFKWMGERDCGYISDLTFDKVTKNAHYSIKSSGRIGCIYNEMELDNPDDPLCYISSVLTKSITENDKKRISDHKLGKHLNKIITTPIKLVKKPIKKKVVKKKSINKSELKVAIEKQKDFLNGKTDKNFW